MKSPAFGGGGGILHHGPQMINGKPLTVIHLNQCTLVRVVTADIDRKTLPNVLVISLLCN